MYDDHYGLTGRPFQLTPDPRFWFDTATHRKAMAYLGYGLSQGEGFVVITGDPGAGKTTLMGHLLGQIDEARLNVIKLVSTQLRPDDLLRVVGAGLSIDAAALNKADLLSAIERGLHHVAMSGRRTLLIIDEAQGLPVESLEELRLLSNFQAGGYPLLQIFLLGQPEFRATLNNPGLEQLRQRVIAMHHLGGMERDEVEPYLIHRLSCVGWKGKPRFTNDAVAKMHEWSQGSPRQLNQLASRVLLFGAVERIDTFGEREVDHVISDLHQDMMGPRAARDANAAKATVREAEDYLKGDAAPLPMGTPLPAEPVDPVVLNVDPAATAPAAEPAAADPALLTRIEQLEAQISEQDDALRRVLTLLVDWVEAEEGRSRPDISSLRGNAA